MIFLIAGRGSNKPFREYFLKKHQIHPQRYTPRPYNYIPMRQKNLPYQRRIY